MTRDGIAGLICLALAIGMLVLTRGLPQSSFVPLGPDFYPRIVLVIMAVLSALLIAADLWQRRAGAALAAASAEPAAERRNYRLVGITFAVFAGYVILLPFVGYRVATFIFVAALQSAFDPPRGARRWAMVLISALASAAITFIVFQHYLSVLLPRGKWTDW
ncbi:MAG: tripartite tricarboxylate transporter TctB family protein [Betaproteobacteria bacterium]|nr:MAG: tripartite tricarboxylate transporter TctB family protein [Betaproteobacteria bacterium]